MSNFASYVTRTAFQLSLSKNMIVALQICKDHEDTGSWRNAAENFFTYNNNFCTPVQSLRNRGLVEHHDRPAEYKTWDRVTQWEFDKTHRSYTLTEAGKLVYQLCVLAGLIEERKSEQRAA